MAVLFENGPKQPVSAHEEPQCDFPKPAVAAVICVTLNPPESERKRQDRSVRRAEKRCRQVRMLRVRGLIRPTSGV
jgi:hypothetical protein